MKFVIKLLYCTLLIIILFVCNCSGSKKETFKEQKYLVSFVDYLSFTDYVFFELKDENSKLIKYAITHKIKNIDSLEILYDRIELRKEYSFELKELESPVIIKSRVLSFYYRNGKSLWENDTFKTQMYSIENAVDKYILTN